MSRHIVRALFALLLVAAPLAAQVDRDALLASPKHASKDRKPVFKSIVGADQTAAPAGPMTAVPALFFPTGPGTSGMRYDFQTMLPVAASSATTLPRNVQQA